MRDRDRQREAVCVRVCERVCECLSAGFARGCTTPVISCREGPAAISV